MLRWKRILLGVTGGIAAYKAADLTSKLAQAGAEVMVSMTSHAREFVSPLTFMALSSNRVITDMFEPDSEAIMSHIDLARRVDCVVVAPCTANMIGKLAGGIADDWLSTTIMATRAPVLICPAMNTRMFENPVVQSNLATLAARGFIIAPTAYGELACGETGYGRLIETPQIMENIQLILSEKDLEGQRMIITAGPTREHLDPVRYLSNPSSGKMGYACARQAAMRGAEVVLVSGPTELDPPVGVTTVRVTSAREMLAACLEYYDTSQVVIKAAAPVDFGPRDYCEQKVKKADAELRPELKLQPDILKSLGQRKNGQILIGFAAETENVINNARSKMLSKNLDLIVANDVAQEGAGFGSDTNIVKIIDLSGHVHELPILPKDEVAGIILDRVAEMIRNRPDRTA